MTNNPNLNELPEPSDGSPSDGSPNDGSPSDGWPSDGSPSDGWCDDQTRINTFAAVSLNDVDRFASLMLQHLPPGIAVGLIGTLGAGKTRLVQAIAKAAQVDDADVTSPTFTLLQTYHGDKTLHHLDAYRIQDEEEFLQLGVDELFDEHDAWTLVEWADRVRTAMPMDTLWIRILIAAEPDQRMIMIASPNERLRHGVQNVSNDFYRDLSRHGQ